MTQADDGREAVSSLSQGSFPRVEQASRKEAEHLALGRGALTERAVCAGCHGPIKDKFLLAMGKMWHEDHFLCAQCKEPCGGGNFVVYQNKPHCLTHFGHSLEPSCVRCEKPIRSEYVVHNQELYHCECFSCSRCSEPLHGQVYYSLGNGDVECEACNQTHLPVCRGCSLPITDQEIYELGGHWHPAHFQCAECKKELLDDGEFYEHDGLPYCAKDFTKLFRVRCRICSIPIQSEIKYTSWGEPYCAHHDSQYPRCTFCHRPTAKNINGGARRYKDGRTVCNTCGVNCVHDAKKAEEVLAFVRSAMEKAGVDLRKTHVRVELVEPADLKQFKEFYEDPCSHPHCMLAYSAHQTKAKGSGPKPFRAIPERLVCLSGMPFEHTAAAIAHALGHAFMMVHNRPAMAGPISEGLSTYFETVVLSHRGGDIAEFLMSEIDNRSHADRRYGLREATKQVQRTSLKNVIQCVLQHNRFPRTYSKARDEDGNLVHRRRVGDPEPVPMPRSVRRNRPSGGASSREESREGKSRDGKSRDGKSRDGKSRRTKKGRSEVESGQEE